MQSIWGKYLRRRSLSKTHSKASLLKRFIWSNYFETLESLQYSSWGMSSIYAKSATLRFDKSKEVILRCGNTSKTPIEAWYSHIRISSSFEILMISKVLRQNTGCRGTPFRERFLEGLPDRGILRFWSAKSNAAAFPRMGHVFNHHYLINSGVCYSSFYKN